MSVRVVHRLTGYDRKTELLTIERDIPPKEIPRVKKIAGVRPDDLDAIGSYPLDQNQAKEIASLLDLIIDAEYDFFLEPFAECAGRT